MAATVRIMRLTGSHGGGASPDYTNITSACTRMSTSDVPSPGTDNPIPIPSSGSNYSFWVTTNLYSACAPDNSIDNIEWYTDGTNSFGTGTNLIVSNASGYVQAVGNTGSSGSLLDTTNHTGLKGAASNAFTYTSNAASRLAIAGSIASTTGCIGDEFVVFQLRVDTTATAGNTGEEQFTWSFDES